MAKSPKKIVRDAANKIAKKQKRETLKILKEGQDMMYGMTYEQLQKFLQKKRDERLNCFQKPTRKLPDNPEDMTVEELQSIVDEMSDMAWERKREAIDDAVKKGDVLTWLKLLNSTFAYDNHMLTNDGWAKMFSKLISLGATVVPPKDGNTESVEIKLPDDKGKSESILIYILTGFPNAEAVLYSKAKRTLTMTW